MRRQHMGNSVEQRSEVTGEPGVPGVRVDHRGRGGVVDHVQVRGQRHQCRVRASERGIGLRDVAVSRGAPMQCTSTSHSCFSWATSSVTCTPAPPYTSGGYSRVIIATRMLTTVMDGAGPAGA